MTDWNYVKVVPGIMYQKDNGTRLICQELMTRKLFSVDLETGQMRLAPKDKEQFIKALNRIKAMPFGVYETIPKPKRYEKLEAGMIRDGILCADGGRGYWYLMKNEEVWMQGRHAEMLAVMNEL